MLNSKLKSGLSATALIIGLAAAPQALAQTSDMDNDPAADTAYESTTEMQTEQVINEDGEVVTETESMTQTESYDTDPLDDDMMFEPESDDMIDTSADAMDETYDPETEMDAPATMDNDSNYISETSEDENMTSTIETPLPPETGTTTPLNSDVEFTDEMDAGSTDIAPVSADADMNADPQTEDWDAQDNARTGSEDDMWDAESDYMTEPESNDAAITPTAATPDVQNENGTLFEGEGEIAVPANDWNGKLTYGTQIQAANGEFVGPVTGIVKSESGMVTAVTVADSLEIIPVSTLSAQGDYLVTSKINSDFETGLLGTS